MAGAVPTLFWFDRWDERVGLLHPVGDLVHTEEVNADDALDFCSREVPAKGDRLLWLDGDAWREHVVVRTVEPLEGPCRVHAESSLFELRRDFVEEAQLVLRTARQALTSVLATTRWGIASCADLGEGSTLIYHQDALWALRRVAAVWGGELAPEIEVSGGRVASRSVRLESRLGSWRGLRLSYGKNMSACTRTVLDAEVHTALYGFGAGLPFTDDEGNYRPGYRRRLNFGDVNGGVRYVADERARERWGRWNAERTERVHSFGQVTFPEVTDAYRLRELTWAALDRASQPKVSYEIDAAALSGGPPGLGDDVAVVDTTRTPEWRLRARVMRRERTFGEGVSCRVTVGTAGAGTGSA